MVKNQMESKIQPLLDLIEEAQEMVRAGQGDTLISIGTMKITAQGLVNAADHIRSPISSGSSWERFSSAIIAGFNSTVRRLPFVAVILFTLALLIFVVFLSIRFNQPSSLSISTPVGQVLRPSEQALVENLLDSNQLNSTSTLIAQHLIEGTCPSTGFWRNNEGASLLVCFTHSDYPGALRFVDGEYLDGGVFPVEGLRGFIDRHALVKIHGGE